MAPYFKAVFEGHFTEAKDQVLELPDEDVTMFKHFQLWLYTDSFLQTDEIVKDIHWGPLISLYVFAEVRGIPDLQNGAIDAMIDKVALEKKIPTPEYGQIYERTHGNSPLRRLAVDWLAHLAVLEPPRWLSIFEQDGFPKQALIDLAFTQYALRLGTKVLIRQFKAVREDYHVKLPVTAANP